EMICGKTMKGSVLMMTPPGVPMAIGPLRVSAAIVTTILFDDVTSNGTGAPPRTTVTGPKKFVPLIVIRSPTTPFVGVNEVSRGGTKKKTSFVLVPSGVTTVTRPLVAAGGTTARIWVSAVTLKLAFAPLNRTAVAFRKFAPERTTSIARGPVSG